LAFSLRDGHVGRYVGTDILSEAVEFARSRVDRADWDFVTTTDTVLPLEDGVADFVCFFSVFTHLNDEDCYRFLMEAKRVGKPGAVVVFSFLDFDVPCHWPVFQNTLEDRSSNTVLNRFHAKSTIQALARALDLTVEKLIDGSSPCVRLLEPIHFDDGRLQNGIVEFGQSVCVLRVPPAAEPRADRTNVGAANAEIVVADGYFYNASFRGNVGEGEVPLLAGFSIHGHPRRVLIRGVGPSLVRFGVNNPCSLPRFEVSAGTDVLFKSFRYGSLSESRLLYSYIFSEVGAFQLDPSAADAVLIATLAPGNYNVSFTSGGGSGSGLLELYMLPVARFSPDQIGTTFPHNSTSRNPKSQEPVSTSDKR